MVRNDFKMKKLSVMVVLGVLCAALICSHYASDYHVECEFVVSSEVFQTNALGEVIQPKPETVLGVHTDQQRMMRERMSAFLSGEFIGDFLKECKRSVSERFLESFPKWSSSAVMVSNAMKSIRFEVTGQAIATIRMSARSSSGALASDVVNFVAEDFCRCMNGYDEYNLGKALAWCEWEKRRREKEGGDVAEILEKIEIAKATTRKRHKRLSVLKFSCARVLPCFR